MVMPGSYKVSFAKRVNGVTTPLGSPQDFNVLVQGQSNLSAQDRAALVKFQQKVARLQRALGGATESANELRPRLAQIKRALFETPTAPDKLMDEAISIEKRANEIIRALRGDTVARSRNMNTSPSISDRVGNAAAAGRSAVAKPTRTQESQYEIAAAEFEKVLAQLRALVEGELAKLEKAMEAAGAPWTPGRLPEWKNVP
jgi:chromosome segregation ATPase